MNNKTKDTNPEVSIHSEKDVNKTKDTEITKSSGSVWKDLGYSLEDAIARESQAVCSEMYGPHFKGDKSDIELLHKKIAQAALQTIEDYAQNMDGLKPCPFCADDSPRIEKTSNRKAYFVECKNPRCPDWIAYSTKEKAIKAWNTRTTEAMLREEVHDLRSRFCDAERVIAWLDNPERQLAMDAFTEGNERQIAYRFDGMKERIKKLRDNYAGALADCDELARMIFKAKDLKALQETTKLNYPKIYKALQQETDKTT